MDIFLHILMDQDYFSHFTNEELKLNRIAHGQNQKPQQGKDWK